MELKETISELSDESLIKLWKSEQLCTYKYFANIYRIKLSKFIDCIDNGNPLPIYIREHIEDCLINGLRTYKTYNFWEVNEELKNYTNTNAVIFIDGDHMMGIIKLYAKIILNITNIKFIVVVHDIMNIIKCNHNTDIFNRNNCYVVQTFTHEKEASDHMLSMLISSLNVLIPKYIDFIIFSNDKFSLECIKIIENNCRLIKLVSDFLIKENIDKQVKNILNKYNILNYLSNYKNDSI